VGSREVSSSSVCVGLRASAAADERRRKKKRGEQRRTEENRGERTDALRLFTCDLLFLCPPHTKLPAHRDRQMIRELYITLKLI